MKCGNCNAVLRANDELKWECNSCHQMCKANLTMLGQIQAQRNNGYTGTMVSCPFCGGVLDDGHETIHWDCIYCGTRQTGDIKTFLKPEIPMQPETPAQEEKPGSPQEGALIWEDGETPEEEKKAKPEKKGFFADEEEKNRFLAESTSQTLGEEIPDSFFEDIPLRRKPKTPAEAKPPASPPVPGASATGTGAPTAGSAPKPPASPSTPGAGAASAPRRSLGPKTASGPIPPTSTAFEPSAPTSAPPTGPDTDRHLENVSFEKPREPEKKQIWPKVITAVISIILVAAIGVGVFVAVQYFLSPTRQFRSAVEAADYVAAEELFNSKIKGNQEDERVAEIAVEHFLSKEFEAYKNGTSDGVSYNTLKDFAENVLNMNTANYEMAAVTASPEPMETQEPVSDPSADVSASPEASAEPSGSPAATEAAVTEEPKASEEPSSGPEATPEASEEPQESGGAGGGTAVSPENDISAVLAQAEKYTKQKKYEEAYKYLASYKKDDTTGQISKEMSSVKKKWKAANIKEFKALRAELTIVYVASEKRYHIVPKGYYTNYNQIARSNNVGGIAYMDAGKKKVSVTKIGKQGALSSFGKANRAKLMKFKEMIEKYSYLAKEI